MSFGKSDIRLACRMAVLNVVCVNRNLEGLVSSCIKMGNDASIGTTRHTEAHAQ